MPSTGWGPLLRMTLQCSKRACSHCLHTGWLGPQHARSSRPQTLNRAEDVYSGQSMQVLEHGSCPGVGHADLLSAAQQCQGPATTDKLRGRRLSLQLGLSTHREPDLLGSASRQSCPL